MSKNIILKETDTGFEVIGKDVVPTTKQRIWSATIDDQSFKYVRIPNMLYPDHTPKFVTSYKQLIGEAIENIKAGYGDFIMMLYGSIFVCEVVNNDVVAKKLNEKIMQEWIDKEFKYCIERATPGAFGRLFVAESENGKDELKIVTNFPNGIITFDSYDDAKKRIESYEEKVKEIIDATRGIEGAEALYEAYSDKLRELGENFSCSVLRLLIDNIDDNWSELPALVYPKRITSDLMISQIPINLKI